MSQDQNKLGKLVKQAMTDPALKARLKANPKAVLAEVGIKVPDHATVKVVEDTADTVWIRLPYVHEGDLSVEELEAVAGGFTAFNFSEQWGTSAIKKPGTP